MARRTGKSWLDRHPLKNEIIDCVRRNIGQSELLRELRDGGDTTATRNKLALAYARIREEGKK